MLKILLIFCYKVLFTKKGIIKNYGNYFVILIIIIHIFIIIIFYSRNMINQIKNKINKISYGIRYMELFQKQKIENINENKKEIIIYKNINKNIIFGKDKKSKNILQVNPKINRKDDTKDQLSVNKMNNRYDIKEKSNNFNKSNYIKNDFKMLKNVKKIMAYTDNELNNLSYNLALKIDIRKFFRYYISLLKTKHPIFFTFVNNNDYNIKIIKIDLFLFNLVLFFVISTLFFTDDTMHKTYEDKGAFNFIYQLPQVIYSSLIPYLFSTIFEMLALTEEGIIELKEIKESNKFANKAKKVNNKFQLKILIYFIVSIIFLIFFWYYISIFCAIYSNTQIHLIKDTFLSFISSLFEPFLFYIIPGIFRIPSLSNRKKKRNILYKLSQVFQAIF